MFKYVLVAIGALFCACGVFYFANSRLEQTLKAELEGVEAAKGEYAVFAEPYPGQELVDTALAAEIKYLPEGYKLHIKLATDSIVALVARDASLPDSLKKAVGAFNEDDYMRCFWYRWAHKDLLGMGNKRVFPYTALDSLACVILYPTLFKE